MARYRLFVEVACRPVGTKTASPSSSSRTWCSRTWWPELLRADFCAKFIHVYIISFLGVLVVVVLVELNFGIENFEFFGGILGNVGNFEIEIELFRAVQK